MTLKFLKNITKKGIRDGMTPHEEKVVILTNFILLLASVVTFFRIFLFFYINDEFYALISFVAFIIFSLSYYLNTKGFYDIAKFTLMLVGNFSTFYKELLSAGNSNQIFLTMASFGVVFLIFSIKEKTKLILALSIPTINIVIVTLFPNLLVDYVEIDRQKFMYEKLFGILSSVVILVLVIWYFVKKSTDFEISMQRTNNLLTEYNNEIILQNELIETQNVELEQINNDLTEQKRIIEIQHNNMISSVEYASKIQKAVLPLNETINNIFPENFVFYKPKDIVSGDFYWFAENLGIKFAAVVDCTGHGVPGAFMSMIASQLLNKFVIEHNINDPKTILYKMDSEVQNILKSDNQTEVQDGMDISLFSYQQEKKILTYAGAKRPLYYKINSQFFEIKGNLSSIAGFMPKDSKKFENHELSVEPNTIVYLTSDGFSDQLNINKRKYGRKRLSNFLSSISSLEMKEQRYALEKELFYYSKGRDQIDDITIIGIKF